MESNVLNSVELNSLKASPTKHAYFFMVHNHLNQVKKMVELFDNERNDLYFHVDAKVENFENWKREIERTAHHSNVFFTKRFNITWGGYNQIACRIAFLEEAIKRPHVYYHAMSGADLPLKTQQEILDFYDEHSGKEFVHFGQEIFHKKDATDRVKCFWVLQDLVGNSKKFHLRAIRQIQKAIIFTQSHIGINRVKDEVSFYGGEAWWDVTEPFAKYIVSKKDWIAKIFYKSKCGDEVFVQTLLYNSPFWENCFRRGFDTAYDEDRMSIMRYIDWNRGIPYTWRKEDFEMLINSDYLFARKFDESVDNEIIDMIYHEIKARQVF